MKNSHFKIIPGFTDYAATDNGEIISLKFGKWRVMKQHKNLSTGYMQVNPTVGGVQYTKKVHRLVMAAFHGSSDLVVNHLDGNKLNNNLSNLEYCTIAENNAHALTNGFCENARLAACKLSDVQVIAIRALKGSLSQTQIASLFGVTQAQVSRILNNIYRRNKTN